MDKQKSYGENYQQIKPKHKYSNKFLFWVIFCSVFVVMAWAICIDLKVLP